MFVFFSSRRRHTRFDCDWSSDVCSSDLWVAERATLPRRQVTVQLSPEVAVRVKVLEQPDAGGGGVRLKPEYDDVLAAARALGRPPLEIARAAERDAEALVAKSKE